MGNDTEFKRKPYSDSPFTGVVVIKIKLVAF